MSGHCRLGLKAEVRCRELISAQESDPTALHTRPRIDHKADAGPQTRNNNLILILPQHPTGSEQTGATTLIKSVTVSIQTAPICIECVEFCRNVNFINVHITPTHHVERPSIQINRTKQLATFSNC